MITSFDKLQADFKALSAQGIQLYNAMQVEQYPDRMEAHFKTVIKKDYEAFKKTLPVFVNAYQAWYSEAQLVIRPFLPDRLSDFTSLYEPAKGRKEVRQDNYVIEDYLKNLQITTGFDKRIVAGPTDAIPLFQQQLNILNSVDARFESSLFETREILQAELFDGEIAAARELCKKQFVRSAGAICGVVLEKHLDQVRQTHNLKLNKKRATIQDYNDLLKKYDIYDFHQWRIIQFLGEVRDTCCQNKKTLPTTEEVNKLIDGVDTVIKTVF